MSTLIWAAAVVGLLIGLFGLFLCAIAGQSDRRAPKPTRKPLPLNDEGYPDTFDEEY